MRSLGMSHTAPKEGVVLTDYVGKILRIHPGETLSVEVLEGRRSRRTDLSMLLVAIPALVDTATVARGPLVITVQE